jgi:ribosome-associated protein
VLPRARSKVINVSTQNSEETLDIEAVNDSQVPSDQKVQLICEAADEMKARDITILDVRGQTIVSDFFIMATGTSVTHIQSIAEGVRDRLRERSHLRAKPEGDAGSYWMLLDYSDVILHIFDEETREFYDLERLWADAKVSHCGSERSEAKDTGESSTESGVQGDETL